MTSSNKVLPIGLTTFPSVAGGIGLYVITALLLVAATCYIGRRGSSTLPMLNPKTTTRDFMTKSKQLFIEGRQKFPEQPYLMKTYLGNATILPTQMLDEVRNMTEIDFWPAVEKDHHGYLPGFEPFKANYDGPTMINRHLTKSLNKYTRSLYEEAKLSVADLLTDSFEWHEVRPQQDFTALVSRTSSRLFLGAELCRDLNWTKLTAAYTHTVFQAVQYLRQFPPILRPLANQLLPMCRQTRVALNACRDFIRPVVAARQVRKEEAIASGRTELMFDDAIEWCQKEYATDRDPADSQISLAMVAIHPTTDQLTETMLQIARHPELFGPLRNEISSVLVRDGIKKTALGNLKLLDAVIKESQRVKPVSISNFRRVVVKDVKLSNGLRLLRGENVWIDVVQHWDPKVWENPDEFDPSRYTKLRGTSKDHLAHLVSTSPEHMGFGHGRQACPGRFFAAHMMKILMCHLLLKYDWKLPEEGGLPTFNIGLNLMPNPRTVLLFRRRKEEIDLDQLEIED